MASFTYPIGVHLPDSFVPGAGNPNPYQGILYNPSQNPLDISLRAVTPPSQSPIYTPSTSIVNPTGGGSGQDFMSQLQGALQSDPTFGEAQRLLNPNDAQANYDVSMHGAEAGVGRGIYGSGAASETTGRLRQSDIERRAALGSNLLTQAVGRQIQAGQLSLEQARLLLDDKIRTGQLSIEQARLALDWFRTLNPNQYGGGGSKPSGGGGGLPPLPGSGGGAPSQPSWRTYGGGLPPYPDTGFNGTQPYNMDTNPPYTTNPYTNPESPLYADPTQGYDYVPPGGFDFNSPGFDYSPTDSFLDQGVPLGLEDYYA